MELNNFDFDPKIEHPSYYLNPPQESIGKKLVRELHRQEKLNKIVQEYDAKFGKPLSCIEEEEKRPEGSRSATV